MHNFGLSCSHKSTASSQSCTIRFVPREARRRQRQHHESEYYMCPLFCRTIIPISPRQKCFGQLSHITRASQFPPCPARHAQRLRISGCREKLSFNCKPYWARDLRVYCHSVEVCAACRLSLLHEPRSCPAQMRCRRHREARDKLRPRHDGRNANNSRTSMSDSAGGMTRPVCTMQDRRDWLIF